MSMLHLDWVLGYERGNLNFNIFLYSNIYLQVCFTIKHTVQVNNTALNSE